jgi:hypothetical protein
MQNRRNDFDVTNRIQTTDPNAVEREISRLFRLLYPGAAHLGIELAFADVASLYAGTYPGFHACDTAYHDLQHVMDVTLAMARLMDGYERSRVDSPAIGVKRFQLGIISALFHDMGYLRKSADTQTLTGAVYTRTHVSRATAFLREYLGHIGFTEFADAGAELIHFTGFEKSVAEISIADPVLRLLGTLLGSADIIAQMADRCYLEKCRDRLYPEFVAGGIDIEEVDGKREVIFKSGEDLVKKTPAFYEGAVHRLEHDLGGAYNYAATHFGGFNLYLHAAARNVHFAKQIGSRVRSALRRTPPNNNGDSAVDLPNMSSL